MLPAVSLGMSPSYASPPYPCALRLSFPRKQNPVNSLSSLQEQRGNINRLVSWDGCVVKGVQREFPLVGVWGCPPRYKKSPKIGGLEG